MRFEDFMTEYPDLAMILRCKPNHSPIRQGTYIYYRRGTEGTEVYRVLTEDYKMPRERINHCRMDVLPDIPKIPLTKTNSGEKKVSK